MNLKNLSDQSLLSQTKVLVQKERELLVEILHHLREVERRRLFCDLKYGSLFDYAVKELGYSEAQAGRRIQAMRLLRELPELHEKIEKGSLNLTHLSQAQSYFQEMKKHETPVMVSKKLELLKTFEGKSSRETERKLLELKAEAQIPPRERKRAISPTQTEVRFVMTDVLKAQLEEVRNLLGVRAIHLTFAELLEEMAKLSLTQLKAKKFGKKATASLPQMTQPPVFTPAPELKTEGKKTPRQTPASQNPRYIPRKLKYEIWKRDKAECTNCKSKHHLNYDHIRPVAQNGQATRENLRLLCFQCNQRRNVT